ncbi:thioredoxin-related transmembrane protein 2 isoform X2 [Phalaenopsis equestris]|uniref:thioredoxin-related transmembrane protein 2 isoform X2 n=1 Tax=Phalaenopsis equestris TaxID=78828 RepID=UPI0009E3F979|nr:thioredoxin-related transmembrane protein 2 isoform X2 [Phalaenopsis equestris]
MAAPAAELKNGSHPLPWLNIVITEPFYLLHLLLFFSYFVVRCSALQGLSPDLPLQLLRREIQAVLAFSVLTAVKFVREETWEAFIADLLFYSKVFLFAVTLNIDYHAAFCYSVVFAGESRHLTPLQLETLLAEGNSSRFWLVEFRVLCSSACIRTSRIFPDLSVIYSNKNVSFGIVDLGHFPNVAKKFGISLSGSHPTYILYENAVEVARLPDIINGSKAFRPAITKGLLCQHFELDKKLVEYISN